MMLRIALTLIFVAEIFAFLDQSQLSDNTTSASLNNSAGAAGRGCQPNCQNCTLDSFGNVTVCNRCTHNYFLEANRCEPCSDHCQRNLSSNGPVCRYDGGVCLLGCEDGYYGLSCDKQCSISCQVNSTFSLPICSPVDGSCTFGCDNSSYLANCSGTCSTHCAQDNSSIIRACNETNGYCEFGCEKGYFGLKCDKYCNSNCLENSTSDLPTCERSDGTCRFGCRDTYYGPRCDRRCSNKCNQSLCERDGVCSVGCTFVILGGPKCDQPCSIGCAGRDTECDQHFRCVLGCKPNYWGLSCQPCNDGCTNSTSPVKVARCLVSDGFCQFGCSAGKYGHTCSETCPGQCKDAVCNQATGVCLNKCNKGFYGDYCNSTCSSNCADNDCYSGNGTCVADNCLASQYAWYGPSCSTRCPRNCKNKLCDKDTGHCLHGCIAGFTGDLCDTACPTTCPKQSANDTGLTCNETTLACLNDCPPGKTGPQCDKVCDSSNCQKCVYMANGDDACDLCMPGYYYFNKGCDQCRTTCFRPNNTGNFICNQKDGTCLYRCVDGWYSGDCSKQCSPFCLPRICDSGGCCTGDCKYENYGGCNCQKRCNTNCENGTCYQNETCRLGCKVNTWGHDCSQTCSINCRQAPNNITSSCDRQGQCLFGCKANLTGPQCSVRCPDNCLHGNCDPITMACLDGCVPGHSGTYCDETACGDGGIVDTYNRGNTSSLLEIIFNRLDPKIKTVKIVFN